jgi:hypothetical protein
METPVLAPPSRKREVVGFLLAPALPGMLLSSYNLLGGADRLAWTFATITVVLSYLAALLVGVPCHALLQHFHVKSLFGYLAAGAALGLLGYALVFTPQLMAAEPMTVDFFVEMVKGSGGFVMHAVVSGAVSALVFWLIAVRRNRRASP